MVNRLKLNKKQFLAFKYLNDKTTNSVLYGGGAGGGKSWLGCAWIILSSLWYPGTVSLIGRSKLKTLKSTTLVTFYKVAKSLGLQANVDFIYNDSNHKTYPMSVLFFNDSVVWLKDLFLYAQDPEFDDLGSLELTRVFIDEANQVTVKARNIVFSRIREKLTENNLTQKMLLTCNPAKNWTYADYYKPHKEGLLAENKKFVSALVGDNPFIDPNYEKGLKQLSLNEQQRLLFGNWDYDDDPSRLIDFDKIADIFTNTHIKDGERFISADIALHGSDQFVVVVWSGMKILKIITLKKCEAKEVEDLLKKTSEEYSVPRSNIVYDADGLGAYLRSYLAGAEPFVNGSRPLEVDKQIPNFQNLKTQCYFRLAEIIKNAGLYISSCTPEQRDCIIEELSFVKQRNIDRDGKLQILPKEFVKEQIGRSPDYSDALMMRMFFEIKRSKYLDPIGETTRDRLVNAPGYFGKNEYGIADRY